MCKLLKNNIIVLFCLTYLSFSADAQTFSFAPIIGTCPGSSLTTTATIKGVKVNSIYADNGSPTDPGSNSSFSYELIISINSQVSGTNTGNYWDNTIKFTSSNPAAVQEIYYQDIGVPVQSSNIPNISIGNNASFNGSAAYLGLTVGVENNSPAILNLFGYNTASLTVSSPCLEVSNMIVTGTISTPTPIKLISFETHSNNNTALLNWETAMETNNKGFEIERSSDGKYWSSIGFVNSSFEKGESPNVLKYHFTDSNPSKGDVFYRLKQLDFDGNYNYSKINKITFSESSLVHIFPNPAADKISISGLENNAFLEMSNVTGQIIYSSNANKESNSVNISKFSKGVYYLKITKANGEIERIKFLKK
ncbi:MAG TPA: T9SS type A sorting domain-containing protein [Edaphocola sp.]|nr:T9SS type A sorting domain-containing protein [Edaphocola sp.]